MASSKQSQRGATLASYALILSTFTALSLGAVEGLNSVSTTYLTETRTEIEEPRELGFSDGGEEIEAGTGGGSGGGGGGSTTGSYVFDDIGQFQNESGGGCMTVGSDDKLYQQPCDGSAEQEISVYTQDGVSQLRIGARCVGVEGNASGRDADYIMQVCDSDNALQTFTRNDGNQRWESAGNIAPQMCLDFSMRPSGIVHQWDCHDDPNQRWAEPAIYVPPFGGAPTPTGTGEVTVVGEIPAGADISPDGAFEDDDSVFVFTESSILLDNQTTIDGTVVPAGTIVCSYIVWYDPVSTNEVAGTIDFGAPVIGSAQSATELQNTSVFAVPGVTYAYDRSWEGSDGFDVSGNTVAVTPYAVPVNGDMMRVFTECG